MSGYDPNAWDMFGDIEAINGWLDAANANAHMTGDDAMRVLKVSEEIGEFIEALTMANGRAAAAYIGVTGQNPRKGKTHTMADVTAELADIAVTALCAIQHFAGSKTITRGIMASKIAAIMARANIEPTPDRPPYNDIHGPVDTRVTADGTGECYMSPCPYHPAIPEPGTNPSVSVLAIDTDGITTAPAPVGPASVCGACARSGVGACDDYPDCPAGGMTG